MGYERFVLGAAPAATVSLGLDAGRVLFARLYPAGLAVPPARSGVRGHAAEATARLIISWVAGLSVVWPAGVSAGHFSHWHCRYSISALRHVRGISVRQSRGVSVHRPADRQSRGC